MGQRDVCPLEADSGVGRAGNDDSISIENLIDRPGLESLLLLCQQPINHLNSVVSGAELEDDRSGVINPDHGLTRR